MLNYRFLQQLLLHLPAEFAHDCAIWGLSQLPESLIKTPEFNDNQSVHLMGLNFPHRLGLAAGFDKNGKCPNPLLSLGFSHVEVGTVTPRAQSGNSKPRLFRLNKEKALINRMGFNNKGVNYLVSQLNNIERKGVIGINIGKNKTTALDLAHEDYQYCQSKCHALADYISINISSPNTPNLRQLFDSHYLGALLKHIASTQNELNLINQKKVPLVLKLSPDLKPLDLERILEQAIDCQIDGIIASNTTIDRGMLDSDSIYRHEAGGLSGLPLQGKALHLIKEIKKIANDQLTIIGCGGIDSYEAAQACIEAGADLLQIYTAFIYQGASIIHKIIEP